MVRRASFAATSLVGAANQKEETSSNDVVKAKSNDVVKAKSLPGLEELSLAPPIVCVPRLVVPREHRDAWLAMASELAEATRKEPGCLAYEFVDAGQDKDSGDDAFVMIELFVSEQACESHKATAHFKRLAVPMMRLCTGFEATKGVRAARVGDAVTSGGFHVVVHADVPKTTVDAWLDEAVSRADEIVASGALSVEIARVSSKRTSLWASRARVFNAKEFERYVVIETWPNAAPGALLETLMRAGMGGRALSSDVCTTAVFSGDDALDGGPGTIQRAAAFSLD